MQIRQLTKPNITLFTLTQTFRYLNCCCNFFLYSATSSLFRRELREIFKCSNSLNINQKDTNSQHRTVLTRIRASSAPPDHAINIDNTTAERKQLLATTTTSSVVGTKPSVNFDLSSTSTEPTNGHLVTFKA
jgi:hypothetical protein